MKQERTSRYPYYWRFIILIPALNISARGLTSLVYEHKITLGEGISIFLVILLAMIIPAVLSFYRGWIKKHPFKLRVLRQDIFEPNPRFGKRLLIRGARGVFGRTYFNIEVTPRIPLRFEEVVVYFKPKESNIFKFDKEFLRFKKLCTSPPLDLPVFFIDAMTDPEVTDLQAIMHVSVNHGKNTKGKGDFLFSLERGGEAKGTYSTSINRPKGSPFNLELHFQINETKEFRSDGYLYFEHTLGGERTGSAKVKMTIINEDFDLPWGTHE